MPAAQRSGTSKWLAIAISVATLFVVLVLGVLLAVMLSGPSSKDGASHTAAAGKHEKGTGESTGTKRDHGKKERTFKQTPQQEEAAKRGLTGDTAGSRPAGKDRRHPAGFPATDTNPSPSGTGPASIPGIPANPFDVPPTALPTDLVPRAGPGGVRETILPTPAPNCAALAAAGSRSTPAPSPVRRPRSIPIVRRWSCRMRNRHPRPEPSRIA